MDDTKHKASFLASFFLNSKKSLEYKLNSVDREIIRYLCDCIDMNFYCNKKFETKMPYKQLAAFTGSSDKTVRRRIVRLICLKIIKCNEILNGQIYTFYVGDFLIDLGHHDLPPRSKEKKNIPNLGHGDRHITKASNKSYNYDRRSSNIQNQKNEPKQTAKFWAPGNPDYDRIHKNSK